MDAALMGRETHTQVMVIVDVRASGGRGDIGIPTDAYFAVEEIKDVSGGRAAAAATTALTLRCPTGRHSDTKIIRPHPVHHRSGRSGRDRRGTSPT